MPRNFEIPDDMAEFLDEWAPKEQKADAHALLLDLIERYRNQKRTFPIKKPGRDLWTQGEKIISAHIPPPLFDRHPRLESPWRDFGNLGQEMTWKR